MLTEKENYLMCLRGECPEWVPNYTFDVNPFSDTPVCNVKVMPEFVTQFRINNGGRDIWGVNWVSTESTAGALIPEPNNFLLDIDDMDHWQDIVKAPDISDIDFESMYKRDLKRTKIDRRNSTLGLNLHVGYFQQLVALMGFENGMMAMYECPDEVKELLNYICDFYTEFTVKCMDYYQPDVISLEDDTAAWASPFISPEMYREFLLPLYARQAKPSMERGALLTMHNCGKAGCYLDDLIAIGVRMWEPAQTSNDLDAIKKKYGNKIVLGGGWDARGRLLEPDCTDEEIYESVRDSMNRLAPGGGYCFCGGFLGAADQMDECIRRNLIVQKAVKEIGHSFYKH